MPCYVPLSASKKKFCLISTTSSNTSKICAWGDFFCVFSSVSATVFRYQKGSSINMGTFFFRTTKERGKIFTLLYNNSISDFLVSHDTSPPYFSRETEIIMDEKDSINIIHLHSDGMLVTSSGGLVGFVDFSLHRLVGAVVPVCTTEDTDWIRSKTDCSLLGISSTKTVLLNKANTSIKVSVGEAIGLIDQQSCVFKMVRNYEYYNLTNFGKDSIVTDINISSSGTLSFRVNHNCGSSLSFIPITTLSIRVGSTGCVFVYIGRNEFCVALQKENSIVQTLTLHNTSPEPFVMGCCSPQLTTSEAIIMVSRIDQSFECYKIIVDESKNKFSVTNIESLKGHILPGNVSYCLCHNEIILISYSNIEYQLYSFVGNKFTLFDNYTLDTSNLLFLELVYLSESEYGMVGLSESGVCTLSTQKRVVVVATIEQPHKISSLTVFREGKHIFCVVGCFDGSILVFKNGELLWENLFAHPNTVSRIECTKEVGANGSFFLSLSSFGGSLCGHSRNGEIIFCATQDSVILDFLVDASIGLIFTCTKKSVCAWRLSDGEVEQVFDIKTFSDLYMTGSYRSAEAALSICRHQLYNEVFFSFAISVDVLVSKLECARTVPNEFTVALTILLSSCAACEKENPFSNGFMHTIDRLGLSVPPIASEANFYFAILMESALFDYVDTSKEIVSICETTFNLHESLLQYCKSASIVPEFILLKYYQHFKHFKCRTYTLCRTFFSYIVNTLSSLEMIERFIQIFLNHKDAKCFDFVDFMGTQLDPKDFWGLLSTLSVVWKNTFENFSQVSHLWSLLHQVVDNVLTATVHSSSSKQDCVNTMISLSSSFWLDSGNVNKKKWLDTILEYSFDNNDQSCLHSLEYIASMDLYCFYEKYLFPLYHQKPQWRTALLSFQRRLIEKYQMESYYAPYPLLKIICSLFSTLSIFPKSEFSERIDENVSLIVASTKFLSNVAFHRQLQSLAIGLRDGCVSVLNIKTNDLASFVAHKAAVLCVAYNVHSSSSHDIATVCEQMHRIKIWRAKLNNGFISELFNSSTKNFTLVKSIDLPSPFGSLSTSPTTPNDQFSSRRELLNLNTPCFYRCSLKWVSSSTIKFVSPWSGALEFSV